MIILYSILAALAVFILVLFIRALLFKPQKIQKRASEPVHVDITKASSDLSEMIKCKTISYREKEKEDESEFDKFKALLPKLFPNVFLKCEYNEVGNRAILIKWEGKKHASPTVLMSHFDVVNVEQELWQKDAFSGEIENGMLWGRGTLDTKGTLNAILQSAEMLIGEGFTPEEDMYFAFAGDEEISGGGAALIVDLFEEKGIVPGIVLDEGGAVVTNVFPGVSTPCALIGIAEKGMANIEYSIKGNGGHSSSPAMRTFIGKLSEACVRVEKHPFKYRMTDPAKKMFDALARHSSFLFRFIFANTWCFGPLINLIAKMIGGEFNAMVRTTVAFTQMEGSKGTNVLPSEAKMVSNLRLMEGDTVESALKYVEKTVKNKQIEVKLLAGNDPSRVSVTEGPAWEKLTSAVKDTWQSALVSPYLMVACSDSRHWGRISDKVYRFSAMALSKEERGSIHGNDEKIPLGTIEKLVEFYVRLMKRF